MNEKMEQEKIEQEKKELSYGDRFEVRNYLSETFTDNIAVDVHRGLTSSQKYLSSKYFYDARGSKLFDDICRLPEYYLTKTELSLLEETSPLLMESFANGDLVELGSGSNTKIKVLLDAADPDMLSYLRYVPVDISHSALASASHELLEHYPELSILCIVADFTRQMNRIATGRPRKVLFLGSTIGNLDTEECVGFLKTLAQNLQPQDSFLAGFDMVKSRDVLDRAYNDSQGVTAEFNKNVLNVVNRELAGDFNTSLFDHLAFYNEGQERVEMHLRARESCLVTIEDLGLEVYFEEGETIHTENSHKFTREGIEALADKAGLHIQKWYCDPLQWFSLVELVWA